MTKNEIKSALTAAGIEFKAKANLETLQALHAEMMASTSPKRNEDGSVSLEKDDFTMSDEELSKQTLRNVEPDWSSMSDEQVRASNCPACGIPLDNGVLHIHDEAPNAGGATLHQKGLQSKDWACMGCGAEFGAEHAPYIAPKNEATGTGLKIEKDRVEQNGIKRPSIGGKCRAIWDALDEYRAETGELPTSKTVRELAADSGWNPNNASIEYYQWRKFNGIAKQA